MPKPVTIHIEVEELHVGRVMRQLHNTPGVARVNFDLGTPKHQDQLNGARLPRGPYKPRKHFGKKGSDFILELLFKDAMPAALLKQHFTDVGRSANSIQSQIHNLKQAALIKPDDKGGWMLTKKARDRMRHIKAKK